MNKKLIAPILTAVAMLATSIGSTFALFASKASSEINIESGKVHVVMESSLNWALSRYEDEIPFDAVAAAEGTSHAAIFENSGVADLSADLDGNSTLNLDRISPMDQVNVNMVATNNSNIDIKWRYVIELKGELIPGLEISIDGVDYSTATSPKTIYGRWSDVVEPSITNLLDSNVLISFPDREDNNNYQNKEASITFKIESVQGNAVVEDPEPEPTTVHLTGVVRQELESDHYDDNGVTIGEFIEEYGLTDFDGEFFFYGSGLVHVYTVTYTIPAGTPANATLICDPVIFDYNMLTDILYPGGSFCFTYKIVNESGHDFDISNVQCKSDIIKALDTPNSVIKTEDGYQIKVSEDEYVELSEDCLPCVTDCAYFSDYYKWIKDKGLTTQKYVNYTFINEYINTISKVEENTFYHYIETEVLSDSVTWIDVINQLCSQGSDYYSLKHCEPEIIRMLFQFSYNQALKFTYSKNVYENIDSVYDKVMNSIPTSMDSLIDWTNVEPSSVEVHGIIDTIDSDVELIYSNNSGVISGAITVLWNGSTGSAWNGVSLFVDLPEFTITLDKTASI